MRNSLTLALLSLDFEPVGRWFEAHHRRAHSQHSHSHHSIGGGSSSSESEEEEEEEDQFDEEDESLLLRLDPREWKVFFILLHAFIIHFLPVEFKFQCMYEK